jgi:hypothetical protein
VGNARTATSALAALAAVLLEHLAHEQDAIGPTLLQMTGWWR